MYQLLIKKVFPFTVIVLASICSYAITNFLNNIHIQNIHIESLPLSYTVLFKISAFVAAIMPILIYGYFIITTNFMLNGMFEQRFPLESIIYIYAIAFLPMLLHYFFLWINFTTYCDVNSFGNIHSFNNIRFMFGLSLYDLSFINQCCWLLIYLIVTLYFIFKDIPLIRIFISVYIPSIMVYVTYAIIT